MTATNQAASRASITVPMPGQKRLIIVGVTGMVGGYTLRYALDHPAVGRITAIGRRKLGISHPKLKEVLHRDFADALPSPKHFPIRTQLSFAWARIPELRRTRSSAE